MRLGIDTSAFLIQGVGFMIGNEVCRQSVVAARCGDLFGVRVSPQQTRGESLLRKQLREGLGVKVYGPGFSVWGVGFRV